MPHPFNPQETPAGLTSPASRIVAVTAHDTNELANGCCRALLVGTAGAATVVDHSGTTATLIPLQAGYNPIAVKIVKSTGLTAANIWALY